jgi:hypothetical protein
MMLIYYTIAIVAALASAAFYNDSQKDGWWVAMALMSLGNFIMAASR